MKSIGLFDLNEPRDLYRLIQEVFAEYIKHPTERNFLFLALGLTHLREWIAESNYDQIKQKQDAGQTLTAGENFFVEIYSLPAFQIIQELCNRGKHYVTSRTTAATTKLNGARVGFARASDSLGQLYFLIDGRDSRDYFIELLILP